jgi:hypothetical protein
VVYLWQTDQWDAEWHRNYRFAQWQLSPSHQSLAASTPMSV